MKPYTIFYDYNGKTFHNVWDAETLEDAIMDAKYQLEDCKTGYTVLEDMTKGLKGIGINEKSIFVGVNK